MNMYSFYQAYRDSIDDWLGFVIAFGNFEGTYYRYIKRHEAARNWALPPSELLRRK
jgi:hypothetical protein